MGNTAAIVWLRTDLRIRDNAALITASRQGAIVPVYIHAPEEEGHWAIGAASTVWLHHSLQELASALKEHGVDLILRTGSTIDNLIDIASKVSARKLFFNRRYEPWARELESKLVNRLKQEGIEVEQFDSNLLFRPESILNKQGNPYKVFTPFLKSLPGVALPLTQPKQLAGSDQRIESAPLDELKLLPRINWTKGILEAWQPGEAGAQTHLRKFCKEAVEHYGEGRDRPDKTLVSRLSPYLHFGEISPRVIWHTVHNHCLSAKGTNDGDNFLRQLCWREFAYHLLFHFPETSDHPLRTDFNHFPWIRNESSLKAWQRGNTGYPLVDAGMRELWHTGWMHNRVRMVVASFLVKHLLISWKDGAEWFWDTLVDADLANNTLGWQWVAGCGADAAPYFRIFNPVTQGQKFDPDGLYVRRWVPEIAKLPTKWLHSPWTAPKEELIKAGIQLGGSYPEPIVDHSEARQRALAALATLKTDDHS